MKIRDYLEPQDVLILTESFDKLGLLRRLAQHAISRGFVENSEEVHQTLLRREDQGTTGIGGGLAIPHCTSEQISHHRLILCRLQQPADFDSLDDKPVWLVFLVLSPKNKPGNYLHLLARIMRLCHDTQLLDSLLTEEDTERLYQRLTEADASQP